MAKEALIVQFPTDGNPEDIRLCAELDTGLDLNLREDHVGIAAGFDYGCGAMNIYVYPKDDRFWECVAATKLYLNRKDVLQRAVFIWRRRRDHYKVIWPENFRGEYEQA
jgi:hypothetical protein